jgi:hypothetical protein
MKQKPDNLTIYDSPGVFIRMAGEDHGLLWRDWLAREGARIGRRFPVHIHTRKDGKMALCRGEKEGAV